MLVQLGAQVARHPLAQDGHQPQTDQCRGLAHKIDERHRADRHPGDPAGARHVEPPFLRRPHHAVDQVTRQIGRDEADQRDDRRRGHAENQPAPVGREVAEQAADHRHALPRHEGLGIANRPGHARGVLLVRVGRRDVASRERLVEYELEILEPAPLAVREPHDRERRIAGAAEQRERAGRESRRLAHRLDTGTLDARDVPVATLLRAARHGDVRGAEGHPLLGQAEGVVQVRERVQLHRRAVPGRFDLRA